MKSLTLTLFIQNSTITSSSKQCWTCGVFYLIFILNVGPFLCGNFFSCLRPQAFACLA